MEGKRRLPQFLVQLAAGYPYWQSAEVSQAALALTGTRREIGVSVPSDVPVIYTAAFSATAACRGLRLEDKATGERLEYSGSLAAGETLTVSVAPSGRVTAVIGSRNVIGLTDVSMKKLPAGEGTLIFTAAENGGTVTANLSYREARSGV